MNKIVTLCVGCFLILLSKKSQSIFLNIYKKAPDLLLNSKIFSQNSLFPCF